MPRAREVGATDRWHVETVEGDSAHANVYDENRLLIAADVLTVDAATIAEAPRMLDFIMKLRDGIRGELLSGDDLAEIDELVERLTTDPHEAFDECPTKEDWSQDREATRKLEMGAVAVVAGAVAPPPGVPLPHASAAELVERALAWIAKQLDGIEKRPGMYGSPEANEMEVATLVGVRQTLFGYTTTNRTSGHLSTQLDDGLPYEGFWTFVRFVQVVNGETTPWPLYAVLREEGMLAEHPRLLGDYARWVAQRWPRLASAADDALPAANLLKAGVTGPRVTGPRIAGVEPTTEPTTEDPDAIVFEGSAKEVIRFLDGEHAEETLRALESTEPSTDHTTLPRVVHLHRVTPEEQANDNTHRWGPSGSIGISFCADCGACSDYVNPRCPGPKPSSEGAA